MLKQSIVCSPKLSRHPNLNKDRLEELLTSIISMTSHSNLCFRIELMNFSQSSKEAESLRIMWEGFDLGSSKITLRVQLDGYEEIWLIDIYLKKEAQANSEVFCNEIKEASKIICEEDASRLKQERKENTKPDVGSRAKDSKASKGADTTSKPSKRVYVRTSEIVTTEKVLEILRKWMVKTGGVQKISQREFGEIISSVVGDTINKQMVIAFLKKGDVINAISLGGRKYIIEVGKVGLAILGESREQQEREVQEQEKNRILESIREFPKRSLPQFRALQNILDLQSKIFEYEKELIRIKGERDKCLQELGKAISLINPENLSRLIETAENSARKN